MYPYPNYQFQHPIQPHYPPPFEPVYDGKREAVRWAKEFEQRHLQEIEETKKLVPSLIKYNLKKANKIISDIEKGEVDNIEEKKKEVDELLRPLRNESARELIKLKLARQQRKMKWKKKKRKEVQEHNKAQRALAPIMEKIIDEWQQSEFAKEEETRKRVQEEKETYERKQREAKENKQKRELASLICRLEQLRRLRYKRKLAEGRPVLDIDRFDTYLLPDAKTDEVDQNEVPSSDANNNNTEEVVKDVNTNENNAMAPNAEKLTETNADLIYARFKEDPEQFYYQAYLNIDNLITIRKEWDRYLVAIPGTGSRIPPFFIPPPPNPNPMWAKFIVNNNGENNK